MRDYWSFEAVLRTFRNTGYGKFQKINGLEWRVRGGDYVLVEPPQAMFDLPPEANLSRIRSLCFLEGTIGAEVPVKKPGNNYTYEATKDWRGNKKTRYAMRLSERDGAVFTVPSVDERRECFEEWVSWLEDRKPGHMIVKGHYKQMITDPDFMWFGCKLDNKIVGATGFVVDGTDGAICFTKHKRGIWWLSRYLWFMAIFYMIHNKGVTSINCGDTADKLKKELGLIPRPQWRVDFSKFPESNNALHVS